MRFSLEPIFCFFFVNNLNKHFWVLFVSLIFGLNYHR